MSDKPGAVAALVERTRGADGIVVGGGDGTIFEVLQACRHPSPPLAVLPLGRGNSLARDLGVATIARAFGAIDGGVDRPIDLLDVTLRTSRNTEWRGVSASNVAIGYPAEVASTARRFKRLGAHSYTAAGLIARPERFRAVVRVDDGEETTIDLTGVIVSNSRYVGPFLGFPRADLGDGVFHTMTLQSARLSQLLHNVSSVTRLRFFEPGVLRDIRTTIHLRLDAPMLVKIDGELRDDIREIDVRLLPRAAIFRVAAT